MSDRHEQARAEAERQIHVYGDDFKARTLRANLNDAFAQGVEWADANPHSTPEALAAAYEAGLWDARDMFNISRRISRAELEAAGAELWSLNYGGSIESWTEQARSVFRAAGFEVRDERPRAPVGPSAHPPPLHHPPMPLRNHREDHDEERSMNPITELSLAHIGTRITLHDQGNIITGPLTAIEAERETFTIAAYGTEQRVEPGRWDRIDVTIGGIYASVSPSAEWEEA